MRSPRFKVQDYVDDYGRVTYAVVDRMTGLRYTGFGSRSLAEEWIMRQGG